MNTLDVVIGLLCLGSAVLGVAMGPLRQISKLGGLVFGLILAKRYAGWAQDTMRLHFVHGDAVAYAILLVAVYIAVRIVGWAVERPLRGEKLSGTERVTGALAGLVYGAALSVVAVFVLVAVSPREAAIFRESKAAPATLTVARWAQAVFPKVIRDPFREKVPAAEGDRGKGEVKEKEGAKADAPPAPPAAQPKNRSRK